MGRRVRITKETNWEDDTPFWLIRDDTTRLRVSPLIYYSLESAVAYAEDRGWEVVTPGRS